MRIKIFCVFVLLFASIIFAAEPASAGGCGYREWINAFQPEKPVFPKPTDRCPADFSKPVFTREGTLACPTPDSFHLAYNAMNRGWTYQPTAGVSMQSGEHVGMHVSPEYFGCTIYHDGVPTKITGLVVALAATDIGWVHQNNLRN